MDALCRGCLNVEDFKKFIWKANIYPVDKNLLLMFERFNKSKDGFCKYEDFVAAVTPFDAQEGI